MARTSDMICDWRNVERSSRGTASSALGTTADAADAGFAGSAAAAAEAPASAAAVAAAPLPSGTISTPAICAADAPLAAWAGRSVSLVPCSAVAECHAGPTATVVAADALAALPEASWHAAPTVAMPGSGTAAAWTPAR
eukprot:359616-Chlamydomonas_euryale.AAC.5